VTASTPVDRLARRLSLSLARSRACSAHLRADGTLAAGVLLGALATVPSLGAGAPLACAVASVPSRKEEGLYEHLVVRAQELQGSVPLEADFRAFPLGAGAGGGGGEALGLEQAKLDRSVSQRLARGQAVVMECRGKDSVLSALAAFGRVQGLTAEVEAQWVDAATLTATEASRAIRLRALPGRPWPEFNATDFSRTKLLKVSETTQVKPLAAAVAAEVRQRGAVSVHAFMADKAAVSTALKALALVPQEHGGQRLSFVPSFGKAKRGSILRLHARPKSAAAAAAAGAE